MYIEVYLYNIYVIKLSNSIQHVSNLILFRPVDSKNIICCNRPTDKYKSDPITVPFFILECQILKNIIAKSVHFFKRLALKKKISAMRSMSLFRVGHCYGRCYLMFYINLYAINITTQSEHSG